MNDVLLKTGKNDWETPQDFFDRLNSEFHFTLDPCSNHKNAKCKKHYTIDDDGLKQDWGGEVVFCNPPYGTYYKLEGTKEKKITQDDWVKKCYDESKKPNTIVVALLPARTDTKRFHTYILGKSEIRFIRGRIRFAGAKDMAPFPSMVVIWR